MVMDDAWLAEPVKRSRLRLVLVVSLVAGCVFLSGVLVQKHFGSPTGSAAAASPFGAGGPPAGFTPPEGGLAGGGAPAAAEGAAGAATGAAAGASDETAVIGTLVSVRDGVWTVEDLGGTRHEIQVGNTVRVVQEQALTADQVEQGATVDIRGTSDDQGRVTATTITLR